MKFLFHPLGDTLNQLFIRTFCAVCGAPSLLLFLRDARNVTNGAHRCLNFNVTAISNFIHLPFDSEKINFLNTHLDTTDSEVALSVEPLFNDFFSK